MVKLRQARADDAACLYRWRIDAETVRQSTSPPPGSLDEHRTWLGRVLSDSAVALYIAYDDQRGIDVGSVRIERRSDHEAEISITVDPEQRGRGYSRDLVARGIDAAGNIRIIARVKAGNIRSLRAFRALGFDGPDDGGGELLRLVHEAPGVNRGANA
jgi:RimJ/RimL family protein N-acetyltransferase